MFCFPRYNITKSDQKDVYSFTSKGVSGECRLLARFDLSCVENIYQFEFGPLKQSTGRIDTLFVTNNRDSDLIIGTGVYIIHIFLRANPNAIVRFSGSTESRTRLFTVWIVKNWNEMQNIFLMYGYNVYNKWERFEKNNRYGAILFKQNHTCI